MTSDAERAIFDAVFEQIIETGEPYVFSKGDKRVAVPMRADEYDALKAKVGE